MTKDELIKIAKDTFIDCVGILEAKNHDYSKIDDDALRNFKMVEFFKLTDTPTGITVRMCDKFMRICNLLKSEAVVKEESILDSLSDLINYAVILKATLIDRKKEEVHLREL